jgi:hypothetical protein
MGAVVRKSTTAVPVVALALRVTGDPDVTVQLGMSTAEGGEVARAQANATLPAYPLLLLTVIVEDAAFPRVTAAGAVAESV